MCPSGMVGHMVCEGPLLQELTVEEQLGFNVEGQEEDEEEVQVLALPCFCFLLASALPCSPQGIPCRLVELCAPFLIFGIRGSLDTSSHTGLGGSFFTIPVPIPVSTPFPPGAQSNMLFECLEGTEELLVLVLLQLLWLKPTDFTGWGEQTLGALSGARFDEQMFALPVMMRGVRRDVGFPRDELKPGKLRDEDGMGGKDWEDSESPFDLEPLAIPTWTSVSNSNVLA